MSTITTSNRRTTSTSPTTLRREFAIPTTSSEEAPESTTVERQFSLIQFDTSTPTPSATDPSENSPSPTIHSPKPSATCSSDSDCASDKTCSRGVCANLVEAAPFGPAGDSNLEPTTKMSTASAIGVSAGVLGFIILLIGLGIWLWRRRGRLPFKASPEAPPAKRTRSSSSATDQKTLVASVPNSPYNAGFGMRHDEMPSVLSRKLMEANSPLSRNQLDTEMNAPERQGSGHGRFLSTEKNLPLPPNHMPLPPPPTEEKRYAINVNINKSMIFEDLNFNTSITPRDSGASRDRTPRYRFEEYLPPVARTPPLSITQTKPRQRTSEYEMESYPRKDSASEVASSTNDQKDEERQLRRNKTLKRLESKPPQLPLPEIPPSPSLSFQSYDWYQDIIDNDQANPDDPISRTPTPSILEHKPARTPTKANFGAALSSNPPDIEPLPSPQPLSPMAPSSPAASSLLHPSTAALSSPTTTRFRLLPTVYTMPSQPPKAQPMRASLQSTTTQKTHMSRSWLPDDGLYLPEEGTHDSYMKFQIRLSDANRPTSYSPL